MEAATEDRVVLEAAAALTRPELAGGALRTLASALDAQMSLLYEEPAGGPIEGHMVVGPAEAFCSYLPFAKSDPLRALKTRLNPRMAVTTNLVEKSFRRSPVYGELYEPFGVEQQLVLRLSRASYGEPGLCSVVFCRGPGQRAWSRADVAPLERLFPSLSSALERARRFSAMAQRAEVLEELIAAGRADCALAAWGLDGRALWLAPNADPALADLTQSGAPPSLASKWAAIVATMAHAAQRPIDTRIELPSGVRGDLWLCAAPRRGAPFVALLTARLDLQERVLRASARFALSAGEQRVLLALADGRSNAELSRDLFISIDTVRTHVQRILKKMRCDSRLKAVTRLQEL